MTASFLLATEKDRVLQSLQSRPSFPGLSHRYGNGVTPTFYTLPSKMLCFQQDGRSPAALLADSSRSRFLRVDERVEIPNIELNELADFQRRDCARPLQLPDCVDRAREVRSGFAHVQKARSYCK